MAEVFVVEPSPKFQNRFVIVPAEVSVKLTVNGAMPMLGFPTKLAVGTKAPVPVTGLVLLPPLPLKGTPLLKLPALVGLKLTARLVEPKPGRLKDVPETMLKGPAPILAD